LRDSIGGDRDDSSVDGRIGNVDEFTSGRNECKQTVQGVIEMEIVFVLIPISLIIILVALWAFVWAVRNDQFEDLEKEAFRILFDNDKDPM
jgi:cbb3-type cytochrome oxidase maturation protein